MGDPTASSNAADTCIITSVQVLEITTDEDTISYPEILMFDEIPRSLLQMDVPAVQEGSKDDPKRQH